eukprot:g1929.t1
MSTKMGGEEDAEEKAMTEGEQLMQSFKRKIIEENLMHTAEPILWVDTLLKALQYVAEKNGYEISAEWEKMKKTTEKGYVGHDELKRYIETGIKGTDHAEKIREVQQEDFERFFRVVSGPDRRFGKREFSTLLTLAKEHVDKQLQISNQIDNDTTVARAFNF